MARRSLTKDTTAVRQRLDGHAIVLVGLMGAGKTTVGRRLAEKLGLAFVDADHEIELAAGQTIPEIFAQHGEAYFRDGERKVIARLLENGAQVLATGGGAFMNAETRATVKRNAISIWLRADFDLLMRRVRRRSNRPLLQNDDPEAVMRKLIAERYPVYAEADITVDSRDVAHTSIVNSIIRSLARWPGWDRLNNAKA
jgi:shikimate kinase